MTTIHYDHLLGIPFEHGKTDCYNTGKLFYLDNYGIDLPDIARPDNWWDAGADGPNLYMTHFRTLGFEVIHPLPRDIRVGDVALMAVYRDGIRNTAIQTARSGKVANHCGVFVGKGKMLHHFYGRRSEVVPYSGIWANTTVAILRHKDVPEPTSSLPTLDFMSMITPDLRRKLEPHVPAGTVRPDGA